MVYTNTATEHCLTILYHAMPLPVIVMATVFFSEKTVANTINAIYMQSMKGRFNVALLNIQLLEPDWLYSVWHGIKI